MTNRPVDVLVIGAGPTGLALAAQLAAHGATPRLVDRSPHRVHESRALAIQPRTLEVLAGLGVTDELVGSGSTAVQLQIHSRRVARAVPMFDLGLADTAYPYLLFLSQAETERILQEHLDRAGVAVERGVELVGLDTTEDAAAGRLRHPDGREERVPARFVVGCDGAHSTVRRLAGVGFEGGSYPQTFVLADLEADAIQPDAVHVFLSGHGMLFLFPLGRPAGWRLLAMRPPADLTPPDAPVTLDEVQALADAYTGGEVGLRDPVWMTNFRLHHRAAIGYRAGRLFLAGDAAHIHSPAGAQGMNTGIQDAVNLGWKLASDLRGLAGPELLETYHLERAPVGRTVLRFTDRAFTVATSTSPVVRFIRTRIAPSLIPLALTARAGRAYAFRTISQLRIHYRRSPLSIDGPRPPRAGPKAGDRVPDAPVATNGSGGTLHGVLAQPGWHLLRCGPPGAWTAAEARFEGHGAGLVSVHQLTTQDLPGVALRRLGLSRRDTALYLIRPDGHVGYRSGGTDSTGVEDYLRRWLPGA